MSDADKDATTVGAEVVDLTAARQLRSPHLAGEGHCMNCKHRWPLVAPIGVSRFECPSCLSFQGVLYGSCWPDSKPYFECSCGNDLFILMEHGTLCGHCGTTRPYPTEADIRG